jgi:membrane protease YdiL (CAAX protease family)
MKKDILANKTNITDVKALLMFFGFCSMVSLCPLYALLSYGINPTANVRFSDAFISSLIIAPVVETLIVHLPIVCLLCIFRVPAFFVVLITSIVFALCHIIIDPMYPLYIFYPGLIMTWAFYYFYTRCNVTVAIITTIAVHASYNFVALVA